METSPQVTKKRHHYVPITYLNGFTHNGRIVAYRKDDPKRPLHVSPSEIAFQRYYYSQPLPGGGRDDNTLEDFFSKIETSWPTLAKRLRAGSGTSVDFEELCTFLTLMRVRVPATRDFVELALAEGVKAETKFLDQRGKLPPKPQGYEDILDHMVVSIDPHMSIHAIPSLAQGFGKVLDCLGLQVLHNSTDISFVTSDNPVVYFNPMLPETRILPYQVVPPYGPIELLFPIDSETMLRGVTGGSGLSHSKLGDRQIVKRMNRFIARFGYRFVFSRDRSHTALIIKHANVSPVLKTTLLNSKVRDTFTSFEWVFGQRAVKAKWKAIHEDHPRDRSI